MQASVTLLRLLFLISLFHVLLLLCSWIFQRLENNKAKISTDSELVEYVRELTKASHLKDAEKVVEQLTKRFKEEQNEKIKEKFSHIEYAYVFTLTTFIPVGKFLKANWFFIRIRLSSHSFLIKLTVS